MGRVRNSTKVAELWVSDRRSEPRPLGCTICKLRAVSPFCLLRELWNTEILNGKSLLAGGCIESRLHLQELFSPPRDFLSPVEIIGMEEAGMFFSRSQPRDQTWVSCFADRFFTYRDTREVPDLTEHLSSNNLKSQIAPYQFWPT